MCGTSSLISLQLQKTVFNKNCQRVKTTLWSFVKIEISCHIFTISQFINFLLSSLLLRTQAGSCLYFSNLWDPTPSNSHLAFKVAVVLILRLSSTFYLLLSSLFIFVPILCYHIEYGIKYFKFSLSIVRFYCITSKKWAFNLCVEIFDHFFPTHLVGFLIDNHGKFFFW